MVEYGTDDKSVRHKLGGFFIALLDFVVLKRLEIMKYFNMRDEFANKNWPYLLNYAR